MRPSVDREFGPGGDRLLASTTRAPLAGGRAIDVQPSSSAICRLGDGACAQAQARQVQRMAAGSHELHQSLLRLQRSHGNTFVGKVLREGQGDAEHGALDSVEHHIERARGSGSSMDHSTMSRMESAFGTDFSGVRIHQDSRADMLNSSLSARAFTTGQDVFFRQGEYNPGSTAGRELLAHELTHVVQQQGGAVRAKLTVGEPGDAAELEADAMARAVVARETASPGVEPEEELPLSRQVETFTHPTA